MRDVWVVGILVLWSLFDGARSLEIPGIFAEGRKIFADLTGFHCIISEYQIISNNKSVYYVICMQFTLYPSNN